MKRVVTPDPVQPVPHRGGGELRAVVGPQKRRRPALDEQLGQPRQDVVAAQSAGDVETQALAGVLIHDGEDPHRVPIGGAVEDEVVGPDVVRALRPAPRAGSIGRPKPPPARGFPGHPQPFLPPEPLHPLVVHPPAFGPQQRRDAPVAVAPEAAGKGDDPGDQSRLVRGHLHGVPLRAARLGEGPAGPTLRDGHDGSHVHDRLPPARRAQKFPEDTSFKMALSRAWSATSRLRRAFSRSSSLRRFA